MNFINRMREKLADFIRPTNSPAPAVPKNIVKAEKKAPAKKPATKKATKTK